MTNGIDWRDLGAVTPVVDQGVCGSCWAFSAVATLESANYIKNGELLNLSQQQLVDCAGGEFGNYGCEGGLTAFAYLYSDQQPIEEASNYPYISGLTGTNGTCNYTKSLGLVKADGFSFGMSQNPFQLQAANMRGPVSVAIEASSMYFQQYVNGTLTNATACCPNCSPADLNHAVTVVGFNVAGPIPYYIVRNSWGEGWGEAGYINIAMEDGAGVCGIQLEVAYPNSLL